MDDRSPRHVDRLTVGGGVTLAIEESGRGHPVLLIHGFPLDRTIWRHQIDHLHGFHCIAPDLRGMGTSDCPTGGYSIASYAEDLAAVLDRVGHARASICGLSMGGYIALEFVRQFRSRVSALVLMDTRTGADTEEGRQGRDRMAERARQEGVGPIVEELMDKLLGAESRSKTETVVEPLRRMMRATPLVGFLGALAAMRDRRGYAEVLETLAGIPTLVVVGEEDRLTPPSLAEALAAAVPGARLMVVPNAGHLVPMEQPETTTGILGEFLRSVKPTS
ncbi:MAG: alpha/beta fold hydrolase [Gemmatimonadales bacterium]|nr:alpha/beta fold hydrolase [Gemmatimonadales bacterium]